MKNSVIGYVIYYWLFLNISTYFNLHNYIG